MNKIGFNGKKWLEESKAKLVKEMKQVDNEKSTTVFKREWKTSFSNKVSKLLNGI